MPEQILRARYLAALLLATSWEAAWAHNPIVIDGGPTDAATAHKVADISASRVAYHHARPGQPHLWLTFDCKLGQKVEIQLGVPKIERYAEVRPATAVLGPGLPSVPDLPFSVPEGMGAVLFLTEGQEPSEFHEEFTGTVSWMFRRDNISLTQDGKYYMVSYVPAGSEAKFWVALGEAEVFGLWDYVRMPAIVIKARRFHEIFPWGGILGWTYGALIALLFCGLAVLAIPLRRVFRKPNATSENATRPFWPPSATMGRGS